jgi:hypothetical protein
MKLPFLFVYKNSPLYLFLEVSFKAFEIDIKLWGSLKTTLKVA